MVMLLVYNTLLEIEGKFSVGKKATDIKAGAAIAKAKFKIFISVRKNNSFDYKCNLYFDNFKILTKKISIAKKKVAVWRP